MLCTRTRVCVWGPWRTLRPHKASVGCTKSRLCDLRPVTGLTHPSLSRVTWDNREDVSSNSRERGTVMDGGVRELPASRPHPPRPGHPSGLSFGCFTTWEQEPVGCRGLLQPRHSLAHHPPTSLLPHPCRSWAGWWPLQWGASGAAPARWGAALLCAQILGRGRT